MNTTLAAVHAVAINPEDAKKSIIGLILIGISCVLSWLTLQALLKHGKQGDYKQAWNVALACVVAFIPIGLGAIAATVLGYGTAMAQFGLSIIS